MAPLSASIHRALIVIIFSLYHLINTATSSDFNHSTFDCVLPSAAFLESNVTDSYLNNVNLTLADFTAQSSVTRYYNTSVGDSPDKVYGYYICRGDVTLQACHNCISNATFGVSSCDSLDGILYSEKCTFRYSNHSMYGEWEPLTYVDTPLGHRVSNFQQFNQILSPTLTALINETAFGRAETNGSMLGFATKEVNVTGDEKIYSLAQCTPDIVGVNCSNCLNLALSHLPSCCNGSQGAMINMPNCQLRYDNRSFYDLRQLQLISD